MSCRRAWGLHRAALPTKAAKLVRWLIPPLARKARYAKGFFDSIDPLHRPTSQIHAGVVLPRRLSPVDGRSPKSASDYGLPGMRNGQDGDNSSGRRESDAEMDVVEASLTAEFEAVMAPTRQLRFPTLQIRTCRAHAGRVFPRKSEEGDRAAAHRAQSADPHPLITSGHHAFFLNGDRSWMTGKKFPKGA